MFTLKQLAAFIQVVELGTFERAARQLNATQSAVSKRISELEDATGLRLFDRSRRRTQLTEDGERLLELAYATLENADQILELSDTPKPVLHTLRVGFTDLAALTWLPDFLRDFGDERPDVRFDITIDMSRTLYQRFNDVELDMVVIPLVHEAFAQPGVETKLAQTVEMALMAREGMVDTSAPLPLQSLAHYPLIGQGKSSGFAQHINHWLSTQGMSADTQKTDNLLALVGLVTAGRGIGVLPKRCVEHFAQGHGLVTVKTTPSVPSINYYVLYHDGPRRKLLEAIAQRVACAADFSWPFFIQSTPDEPLGD